MITSPLTVLESTPLPGGYRELTLLSAKELPSIGPGHYLSTTLTQETPLPPLPIMQAETSDRLQVLAQTQTEIPPGAVLRRISIEGNSPEPDPARSQLVLVSADGALACSIFAASRLRRQSRFSITVFAHFEAATPFKPAPSQILMPACPPEAIAAVPLLDSWNIPSRLTSIRECSGFYHGDIRGLLEHWWQRLPETERSEVQVLGFGGSPFLRNLEEWRRMHAITLRTAEIPL